MYYDKTQRFVKIKFLKQCINKMYKMHKMLWRQKINFKINGKNELNSESFYS